MSDGRAREVMSAVIHGLVAWTLAAATMSVADWRPYAPEAALSVHAVAVPVAILLVAFVYFRRAHPLRPPAAAATFALVALVLDSVRIIASSRPVDARTLLLATVLPALSTFVFGWLAGIASDITWSPVRRR